MIRQWTAGVALLILIGMMGGCLPAPSDSTDVIRIYLVNDSNTHYVSPNLGVCPNGMGFTPHYFVNPPPVIAPGRAVCYTTTDLAGTQGNCSSTNPLFAIGLCGWSYGPTAEGLSSHSQKYGGQIGVQFHCRDTVILRWTDGLLTGGTWNSEILTSPGNPKPSASFQIVP